MADQEASNRVTALYRWLAEMRRSAHRGQWWLLAIAAFMIGAVFMLLWSPERELAVAAVGVLGAIAGGVISAGTGVAASTATARVQIASATWVKRFDAHQEAFTIAIALTEVIFGEEEARSKQLLRANQWWKENALYLSKDAREKFKRMIIAVNQHKQLVESLRGTNNGAEHVKANFADIWHGLTAIVESSGSHISDEFMRTLLPISI